MFMYRICTVDTYEWNLPIEMWFGNYKTASIFLNKECNEWENAGLDQDCQKASWKAEIWIELRIFNNFSTRVFLTLCDESRQRPPPGWQDKTPDSLRQSVLISWRRKTTFLLVLEGFEGCEKCTNDKWQRIISYFTFSYKVGELFCGKCPLRQSWGRRN